MIERTVTVQHREGLHARPAALFVQTAKASGLPVAIAREGEEAVDATSILSVMQIGIRQGDTVTISVEGNGAEDALDALVQQLEQS